jgi:hypothetical protein
MLSARFFRRHTSRTNLWRMWIQQRLIDPIRTWKMPARPRLQGTCGLPTLRHARRMIMIRNLLAGAAAVTLITGAAYRTAPITPTQEP